MAESSVGADFWGEIDFWFQKLSKRRAGLSFGRFFFFLDFLDKTIIYKIST